MSRKSIPHHKICRRVGTSVCGAVNCPLARRANPPGQHGGNKQRQKLTAYASQLVETQKLRGYYGLSAKQMLRYYREAAKSKVQTNVHMIEKMETRLDSITYRLGFAPSLRAARQMVVHRHIMVNGKNVNKPGYQLKVGDEVSMREKSQKIERYTEWFKFYNNDLPYISKEVDKYTGKLSDVPQREQVPIVLEDQLVIEFMAR